MRVETTSVQAAFVCHGSHADEMFRAPTPIKATVTTATVVAVLAVTTFARAQQESVAESLFRQAREDMKRGEARGACPKFDESYRLDPSLGTLLNLALCEEALGHTATAWTKLRQFLDSAPAGDSRVRFAREKLVKLEAQLSWVRLVVDHSDDEQTVQLDGIELRSASLSDAIPVNPGEHLVRVARQTGEVKETSFQIHVAETLDLQVPSPSPSPSPSPWLPSSERSPSSTPRLPMMRSDARPASTTSVGRAPSRWNAERTVAYGLGAVGIAGLLTGGVFTLMAINNRNAVREQCPNHTCRDQTGLNAAHSGALDEKVATVAFVTGAVGLVLGSAALWHSGRAAAVLSVTPHTGSLVLVGAIQ